MIRYLSIVAAAVLPMIFTQTSHATLAIGDIAFVGYNVDSNEAFAIVALADITAGQTVFFTDDDLTSGTDFGSRTEGTFQWTTGAVSAGTVVVFSSLTAAPAVSSGSITEPDTDFNLSGGGDSIIAYTTTGGFDDTASPIAAIENENNNFGAIGSTLLVEGTNYLDVSDGSGSPDGGQYIGPRDTATSFAEYLTLINNPANWDTETSDGNAILPFDATSFSLAAIPEPSSMLFATLLATGLSVSAARRKR